MKTCEVALHFNRTPHILSDFNFQCIDQIQTNTSQDTEKLLITKEAYWSAQLFSFYLLGLVKSRRFTLNIEYIILNFCGFLAPGCEFLKVVALAFLAPCSWNLLFLCWRRHSGALDWEFITHCLGTQSRDFVVLMACVIFRGPECPEHHVFISIFVVRTVLFLFWFSFVITPIIVLLL